MFLGSSVTKHRLFPVTPKPARSESQVAPRRDSDKSTGKLCMLASMFDKGEERIVCQANRSRLTYMKATRGLMNHIKNDNNSFQNKDKPQELKQLKFFSYNRYCTPTYFFFAVAFAFLPPLIYSKSSCHKHPIAFAASRISFWLTLLLCCPSGKWRREWERNIKTSGGRWSVQE